MKAMSTIVNEMSTVVKGMLTVVKARTGEELLQIPVVKGIFVQ